MDICVCTLHEAGNHAAGGHRTDRGHLAEADLQAQRGTPQLSSALSVKESANRRERLCGVSQDIIRQHEEGKEFFIMLSGVARILRDSVWKPLSSPLAQLCMAQARVWVRTGNDEQEYKRYKAGDLFGEPGAKLQALGWLGPRLNAVRRCLNHNLRLALLKNAPRAAFVSAVTSVEERKETFRA